MVDAKQNNLKMLFLSAKPEVARQAREAYSDRSEAIGNKAGSNPVIIRDYVLNINYAVVAQW